MAFKGEVLTFSESLARAAATQPEAVPPVSTSARDAAGVRHTAADIRRGTTPHRIA